MERPQQQHYPHPQGKLLSQPGESLFRLASGCHISGCSHEVTKQARNPAVPPHTHDAATACAGHPLRKDVVGAMGGEHLPEEISSAVTTRKVKN